MTTPLTEPSAPGGRRVAPERVDEVVVRFAGDSGDGMQLTGTQFTNTSALVGNDLATFPDFPAEIRAPAGTLPGVSAFQVRIADYDIHTPGDAPDVLVAMNPAALKVNLVDLRHNGILIVNTGNFSSLDLKKAGYAYNPLERGDLDGFNTLLVDLNKLTREALQDTGLDAKSQLRCKNFFALGMMFWVYNRPLDPTIRWIEAKFKRTPVLVEANTKALKAG
ncbi:MAG TPA: 2-oxoacid:acceptor oxidoreductase family protein, partial [Thermoanaerobaculia bacterium]